MTCIAGIIDKKGVGHLASDSLGSNGHTKSIYKNQKIFQKGEMLIGYTSSYRMGQLLEHSLTMPERKVGQTTENYMYNDFVDCVRKLFKDNGYLKIDSNVEKIGTFIIIYDGRIFKMQDDLSLLENSEDFDTCGSGEDFAQATISTLLKYTDLDSKKILEEAINTAAKYVATVGGKVQYISSSPRA